MIAVAASAKPGSQDGSDLDRGATAFPILDRNSGDGTNLPLAALLIETFSFLLPSAAIAQS